MSRVPVAYCNALRKLVEGEVRSKQPPPVRRRLSALETAGLVDIRRHGSVLLTDAGREALADDQGNPIGIPYAAHQFDPRGGRYVECPECRQRIDLVERKDEESMTGREYAEHYARHPVGGAALTPSTR